MGEPLSSLGLALLLLHVAATLYLLGLVWFVQCVHYPLLATVGRSRFCEYERSHVSRITPIVAPAMVIELKTAVLLVALPPAGLPLAAAWLGLALVVSIWVSTFWLQVPRHAELEHGFDPDAHRRLVRSNWLRTTAWSLRAGLVLWMLFSVGIAGAA